MVNLLEKYGGWPMVKGDEWQEDNWDWIETKKNMEADGVARSLIISTGVTIDRKNTTKRIIGVKIVFLR